MALEMNQSQWSAVRRCLEKELAESMFPCPVVGQALFLVKDEIRKSANRRFPPRSRESTPLLGPFED